MSSILEKLLLEKENSFESNPVQSSTQPKIAVDKQEPLKNPSVLTQLLAERNEKPLKTSGGAQEFVNLELELNNYQDSLTKEDILDNDNLMETVYQSLEARNQPSSFVGTAYKSASTLAGAQSGAGLFGPRNYRGMDKEKVFEVWQNYQRSFAGGQSVTTANELTYTLSAEDKIKNKLGAGYMLFDNMDNAFTGEGSWGEMFDAVFDYTRAGVYDPLTFATLGLGKVVQAGSSKVASAAAKNLLIKSYQESLKAGMSKTAARKAVGSVIAKAAPYTAVDAIVNMGTDVAYQSQLIDTGAQEEYSKAQTAFSAAGAMIIPAAVAASKGVGALRLLAKNSDSSLAKSIVAYEEIDVKAMDLGSARARNLVADKVNRKFLIDTMDETFGKIKGDTRKFLGWEITKKEAKAGVKFKSEELTSTEANNAFFRYFWFGSPDGKRKGYFEALQEAGFVVHDSMLSEKQIAKGAVVSPGDRKNIGKVLDVEFSTATVLFRNKKDGTSTTKQFNLEDLKVIKAANKKDVKRINRVSGIYGQAIGFLDDKTVNKIMTEFEKDTGINLGIEKTTKGLSDQFITGASVAGESLWISSHLGSLNKKGGKVSDALKVLSPEKDNELSPERLKYALSVYKRLLTSHPSTTGTNVSGFTQLVSINSLADVATGTINAGQGTWYKYFNKNPEEATKYFNRASGSFLGLARRGVGVLTPDLEIDYAMKILELNPKTAEKLFRDIAGDGGARDSLSLFNLDSKNPLYKGVESVTKGAQTIALVRMQDELTKLWSLSGNINQAIMREYGISPSKFFENPEEAAINMASERFKNSVLEKATFRTLRETASVNWSSLPANGFFRAAAKAFETATNSSVAGFIVPFGSFANTVVATAADLTGVNAARVVVRKATGKDLDFVTQEGAEAFGKMVAGWTLFSTGMYGADGAIERINQGLAWSQDRNDDGSIQDRTFDWPGSTIRLVSQILAHTSEGGKKSLPETLKGVILDSEARQEIPSALLKELVLQIGGQSFRDLDDFGKSLLNFATDISQGNDISKSGEAILIEIAARPIQGITRPLDPYNQLYGLLTDANMLPDTRQGPKFFNESTKYVNNLFTGLSGASSELPRRLSPTRGDDRRPDFGKQLFGVRGSSEPNLIEAMLNSAGRPSWDSIRFEGPPEVKNYMDGLVYPYLNVAARQALKANPDFFNNSKMKQKDKDKVIDLIVNQAKKMTLDVMKNSSIPKTLEIVRTLSSKNKKDVQKALDLLGIRGGLTDILDQPNALNTLEKIKTLIDMKVFDTISID